LTAIWQSVSRQYAIDGVIAVSLIHGEEATVKRFFLRAHHIKKHIELTCFIAHSLHYCCSRAAMVQPPHVNIQCTLMGLWFIFSLRTMGRAVKAEVLIIEVTNGPFEVFT